MTDLACLFSGLQRHMNFHLDAIRHGQFAVERDFDMHRFTEARDTIGKLDGSRTHPAFNPCSSVIPEGSAQWVGVRDAHQDYVAVIAVRLYEGRLQHLFQSRRIWGDRRAAMRPEGRAAINLQWPPEAFEIQGRMLLCGGLITAPTFRGNKVGSHLVRYMVAAAMHYYDFDTLFAMHKPDKIESGVAAGLFGYDHHARSFQVSPGDGPENDEEWLSWTRRDEIIAHFLGPFPRMEKAA